MKKLNYDNLTRLPLFSGLRDLSHAFSAEDACTILGRKPSILPESVADCSLSGKVVLVTGGAGSIGSEICAQVLALGCKTLIALDRHENGAFELDRRLTALGYTNFKIVIADLRDQNKIDDVLSKLKPSVIFHAAAYKHVPLMENAVIEAVKNNVIATKGLIDAAERQGVSHLLLISSDKAVCPSSVMGATKRVAEMLISSFSGRTCCSAVRFGNVFASSGSVVPIFVSQILSGQSVTVTDKRATRYFMTVSEAVALVLQAQQMQKRGQIFLLDMGEPVNVYTLAENLIKFFGLTPNEDVKIQLTSLRPGEKLTERLYYDSESVDLTKVPGIFTAKPACPDKQVVDSLIGGLSRAAQSQDDYLCKRILLEGVTNK